MTCLPKKLADALDSEKNATTKKKEDFKNLKLKEKNLHTKEEEDAERLIQNL